MLHLKVHLSIEVEEKDKRVIKTPYRKGLTIETLQRYVYHGKYHKHFDGLHEAIVAETEKRLIPKLLEQPVLTKKKNGLIPKKQKYKRRDSQKRRSSLR
jgi:hypothetical protein